MAVRPDEKPQMALRRAALALLARRDHSFHELLGKLSDRFPDCDPDTVVRPVVEQLRTENLQSDARYAESWIRYRAGRGVGPLKIAAELQPKQLERELLNRALYLDGPDWEERCFEVLWRKFRPGREKVSLQERARWQRFLAQRGFGSDHVRAALRKLQNNDAD